MLQLAVLARMAAAVWPQYGAGYPGGGGFAVVGGHRRLGLRYGRWYGLPRVDGKAG